MYIEDDEDDVEDNREGKHANSRYKNIACRSFSKSKRKGLED